MAIGSKQELQAAIEKAISKLTVDAAKEGASANELREALSTRASSSIVFP